MVIPVMGACSEKPPSDDVPARLQPFALGKNLEGPHQTHCILIVEDNPGDVFIMEESLRENNVDCETTVLSDGEQARFYFDAIDNNELMDCPSIVLLDLNLPKRSGHWILNRIRQSRRCPSVAVVVVSSSDAPSDMEQNRLLGANAYFKKPSNLDEFMKLGALVSSLLGR